MISGYMRFYKDRIGAAVPFSDAVRKLEKDPVSSRLVTKVVTNAYNHLHSA